MLPAFELLSRGLLAVLWLELLEVLISKPKLSLSLYKADRLKPELFIALAACAEKTTLSLFLRAEKSSLQRGSLENLKVFFCFLPKVLVIVRVLSAEFQSISKDLISVDFVLFLN